MDLHPWPKKRRSKDPQEDESEVIPPSLPEPKGRYQDLVEHSQDLCCIHDLEGRILSVNAAAARVLEYSVEEMLRLSLREVIAPEFRAEVDTYLKQIESAGTAHGWMTVITCGGERRIWEYHCALRTKGGRLPMVGCIGHDVTEQKQTEKRLREVSESLLDKVREGERTIRDLRLFRTLVDQGNDAIEVVDPDTLQFLDVNEKACSELGYSRKELLSMKVFDINPVLTEASAAKVQEELRRSGSLVMESAHRRKDGITFPVELSMKRVQLDRVYVIAISRDLTERKLAEARLRASQDRYRAVQDRSPVGICWVETPTGRFIGVNSKYCEIAGRTEQDLLSRTFQSITHPDDQGENCAKLRELAEGKVRHYEMEKRYVRPDGSIRWVEIAIVAMGEEGQIPSWHMAIVQDISERKQGEERLREYERVVEGLDEMIVVVDRDYRYVIANRAYLNYRGMENAQVIGRRVDELVNRVVFEEILKPRMDECFQGKVVRYEKKYEYSRIGERDLLVSYFPIEGPTAVDRIACVLQDVTERKRTEEALKKSEEKFSKAFQLSPMSITLTTLEEGRYIEVNGAFEHMTGWRHDKVLGRTPLELGLWMNPAERVELGKRLLAEGSIRDVEARLRRKDGTVLIGLGTSEAIEIQGELCVISVFADITERKRAEERLREYERVVEGLDERIVVLDRDYRYVMANRSALSSGGLEKEQLIGRSFGEVLLAEGVPEEKIELLKRNIDDGFRGKVVHYETKYHSAKGEEDLLLSYFPIEGKAGVDRVAVIVRDITQRKRAEEALRISEQQQRRTAKQLETESARLIEAQAVAKVGSWETDLPGLEITWSEQTHRIFETDPSHFQPRRPDFVKLIHPEDRTKVDAAFEASLEKGVPSKVEYRIVMADGRVKVLEEHWKVFRDEEGRPVRLVGTCSDITERKQAEEALRQSEQRFRVALEGSPTTVFSQDRDLRYTWVYNPQEGMSEEDILGKTDEELFGPEIADRMTAVKRQVLETGKGLRREASMTVDGKTKYCDLTYEPLRDAAGSVVGLTCACISVTHLREITEELRLAKEKLSEEKLYLEQTIDSELGFGEIIGRSGALKEVMEKVSKVAPSNATVLLQGETGTGKELVARALHRLSKRSTKTVSSS